MAHTCTQGIKAVHNFDQVRRCGAMLYRRCTIVITRFRISSHMHDLELVIQMTTARRYMRTIPLTPAHARLHFLWPLLRSQCLGGVALLHLHRIMAMKLNLTLYGTAGFVGKEDVDTSVRTRCQRIFHHAQENKVYTHNQSRH